MPPKETVWNIEDQTRAKHAIVRSYLGAWFPIMSRSPGTDRLLFIDGFAGPGTYADGSPGSPVIALDVLLNHPNVNPNCRYFFVFNESDPDRHESLVRELKARAVTRPLPANVEVVTEQGDFVDLVKELTDDAKGRRLIPLFAFIDPFGYKAMPLDSLRALLSSPGSEVLTYLDVRSPLRFAGKGLVDDHFEALFGSDQFLGAPLPGSPGRVQFFTDVYRDALVNQVGFRYTWSFLMRNAKKQPLYALVYATRNLKGLEVMKDAMWKVAPDGSYSFVAGRAGQQVLLGDDTSVEILEAQLLERFSGSTVPIEQVQEFVLVDTDFRLGILKRRTLSPMQGRGLISTNHPRKGSFPDGTLVTFR